MATSIPQPKHNRRRPPGVKLTRHVRGWVAKIGGRVRWLAPLDKPVLAMERYHKKMGEHLAGRMAQPRANNDASIGALGDLFLSAKSARVQAGELKPRTFADYSNGIQRAVDYFGYDTPALSIGGTRWQEYRAAIAAKLDPHSLARNVGAVRALSRWVDANEFIDRPFRFGTEFSLPSQKALRKVKKDAGPRVFTAAEVKRIVKAADPTLRALFLLALNGGIGNTDLAGLRLSDLRSGELHFERAKTEVKRVVPLWPETLKAIKQMPRPAPADPADANRVFLTFKGLPLVRDRVDAEGKLTSTADTIGMSFWKLPKDVRGERTFYDARTTFQTLADERGPAHVVRHIMGHAVRGDDMSGRYRQSIPSAELKAVVDHVRKRLSVSKISWLAPVVADTSAPQPAKVQRAASVDKPQRLPAALAT